MVCTPLDRVLAAHKHRLLDCPVTDWVVNNTVTAHSACRPAALPAACPKSTQLSLIHQHRHKSFDFNLKQAPTKNPQPLKPHLQQLQQQLVAGQAPLVIQALHMDLDKMRHQLGGVCCRQRRKGGRPLALQQRGAAWDSCWQAAPACG